MGGLARLGRALLGLAFPAQCAACGQAVAEGDTFCPECRARVELINGPVCRCCGRPLAEEAGEGLCRQCAARPPAYDQARSLALHRGPLARVVREFKYRRRYVRGAALAGFWARRAPVDWLAGVELLVPVPLHPRRLLWRGFNQALVLARPLARCLGLRVEPGLLRRRRHTRPQVGLDAAQRRANVEGAFSLGRSAAARVAGRRVLLVDDVFTTGATVEECARVLREAGAARVMVHTLARAAGDAARPGGTDRD